MTKFCVDCKYHHRKFINKVMNNSNFDKCYSPKQKLDLVTGKLDIYYSDYMRYKKKKCGPDGNWFILKNNKS